MSTEVFRDFKKSSLFSVCSLKPKVKSIHVIAKVTFVLLSYFVKYINGHSSGVDFHPELLKLYYIRH